MIRQDGEPRPDASGSQARHTHQQTNERTSGSGKTGAGCVFFRHGQLSETDFRAPSLAESCSTVSFFEFHNCGNAHHPPGRGREGGWLESDARHRRARRFTWSPARDSHRLCFTISALQLPPDFRFSRSVASSSLNTILVERRTFIPSVSES